MAINPRYAGTPAGLVKILHIVLGIITIGLGGGSYASEYVKERIFLWSAVTCFIISFFYFLAHVGVESLPWSNANRGIDLVYHVIAGILLIAGGSLMITSVKKYNQNHCQPLPWGPPCQLKEKTKLAGASISIINGIFYLFAVVLIAVRKNPEEEYDPRIRGYPVKNYGVKTSTKSYEEPSA